MKTRKTIFMLFFALVCIFPFSTITAQFPINSETKNVQFTNVIEFPGLSKEILYKRSKLWMVTNLKSRDNMTELNNSNHDWIVGVGNLFLDSIFVVNNTFKSTLEFKFVVFFKENKIKYSVENFILQYGFTVSPGTSYQQQFTVITGLEDIKAPSEILTSRTNIQAFRSSRNAPYIKSVIDNLIDNYVSFMKNDPMDNW